MLCCCCGLVDVHYNLKCAVGVNAFIVVDISLVMLIS